MYRPKTSNKKCHSALDMQPAPYSDTGESSSLVLTIILILLASLMVFSFGCVKKEEKEIKIGAILALTGDAAKYGESVKNGFEFALQEKNSSGGIKGKKIKIIFEDSKADPKLAVSSFNKLIDIDKVQVVLGPMSSSEVLAVAPLAEKKKIILFTPTASAPSITNAGDYIFRNVTSDLFEGEELASFAFNDLRLKRAAIIYINNDFGIGLKDSFKRKFEQLGGSIADTETFEQGSTDMKSQISKIKSTNPEAVFIVGYKEMGSLLKQAKELRLKTQLLSFSMFEDPEILKIAGDITNGVYYTYRSFETTSDEEVVKKFIDNYKAIYKTEPDIFSALGYDALRIIIYAMERSGTTADGVKQALYSVKDFPAVTGSLSFDKNGDVVQPMGIKVVKDGKFIWYKRVH